MTTIARNLYCLAAFLLTTLGTLYVPAAHSADWVDDWFDQSTTTSPGSLHTQQRGYYTAGGFSARRRMTNDFPLTIQPPKLNVGCGGVDLFLGGFSYLDADYLVKKFERIIQAAPTFAFQMAMSNFCKECNDAMSTLTQLTDYLNSTQINDCRLSKQIAAIPMKNDYSLFTDAEAKARQGLAIVTGQKNNTTDFENTVTSNSGNSPVDARDGLSECPAVVRDIFGGGSVVENVANLTSLSGYSDLLRGLVGDVEISYDATSQNYRVAPEVPCNGNDPTDGFDLIVGKMQKRPSGGSCVDAGMSAVSDIIEGKLTALAARMDPSGGSRPGSDDETFVSGAPVPVMAALRDGLRAGNVDDVIAQLREPLAAAYAAKILNDLHSTTRIVLGKALEVRKTQVVASSTRYKCDLTHLQGALGQIEQMEELSLRYREAANANYSKQREELVANFSIAQQLMQQRNQFLNKQASPAQ